MQEIKRKTTVTRTVKFVLVGSNARVLNKTDEEKDANQYAQYTQLNLEIILFSPEYILKEQTKRRTYTFPNSIRATNK